MHTCMHSGVCKDQDADTGWESQQKVDNIQRKDQTVKLLMFIYNRPSASTVQNLTVV